MLAIDGVNGLVQEQGYELVEIEGGRHDGAGKGGIAVTIHQECHESNNKGAEREQVRGKPTWNELNLYMVKWDVYYVVSRVQYSGWMGKDMGVGA